MELNLSITLMAMAGLGLAGIVKGTLGVGFPVVAMSILTVFLDPKLAVAMVAIPVLATNAWQSLQCHNVAATLRRFWPLIVTLIVGTWLGAQAVAEVETNTLLAAVGVIALMFSIISFLKPSLSVSPSQQTWVGPMTGIGAGVIGGLTTVHGPPVMMYLVALNLKKDEFVGSIGLIWFCGSLPMVMAYVNTGLLGKQETLLSALALIPVFAGVFLGEQIRKKINQELFKKILIFTLFVIGLNLIRRAVL